MARSWNVLMPAEDAHFQIWSRHHALMLLLGTALAALAHTRLLLGAMAAASILGLLRRGKIALLRPGWANGVSLLRVTGALILLTQPPQGAIEQVTLVLGLLALDGADGWIARRTGTVSRLGAVLDLEADGLVMLALCFLVAQKTPPGPWILVLGTLRPLFVLYASNRPHPEQGIGRRWTRAIGTLAPLILAGLLLPGLSAELIERLAVVVAILLGASFSWSWWRIGSRRE